MSERFCACGCGRSLAGMRANAVYHSPACRMRVRRAQNAHRTRTRRATRDGYGTRVYLTAEEVAFVGRAVQALDPSPTSTLARFLVKLHRASDRINE